MRNQRSFVATVAAVLMLSGIGAATAGESPAIEPGAAPAREERHHSLNLGLEGLAGAPSLIYEYLWADGRALVIEAHFVSRPELDGATAVGFGGVVGLVLDAAGRSESYGQGAVGLGAAIGYRRHWRQRQDSPFFGVHAGYDLGESVADRTDVVLVGHQSFYVAGNIGRRWLVSDGVNITARIGAGLIYRVYFEDFGEPEDIAPVRYLDDLLDQLPITVDGELSVGYTF